jgi:SAM-dependent methyltransferase
MLEVGHGTRRQLKRIAIKLGMLGVLREGRDLLRAAAARSRNAPYRRSGAPDGLPLPPTRWILAVAGEPDVAWFLESGRQAAASIRTTLERSGVDVHQLRRILDFGCGCGRVIRQWKDFAAEVHGTDVNPRLVDWCRRHLEFARFEENGLSPPLPYAAGTFDLVYALSVFTHLPEELQLAWMAELGRALETGGHLILTTHGRRYLADLTPEERGRFESGEIVAKSDLPGTNACGAYHPERYVRETLAAGFAVVDFEPEGARGNPYQDLYLFRKV